jgi:predicted permease
VLLPLVSETVTYLADLQDPTPDGTLIRLVNISLAAMAIALVPIFAFYIISHVIEKKGKLEGADTRKLVMFFIVGEALIGGAAVIANMAAGVLSGALGG